MMHYNYQGTFKNLYQKAVELYRSGKRDQAEWFDDSEMKFIEANGWRVQDFYDYGEDSVLEQEPSYEIAQSIEEARREYFLHVQKGIPSKERLTPDALPAKDEAMSGFVWLPRIIAKATGKLKGELDPDIMYCCGGDRKFLKTHDIHPAEFLRLVWAYMDQHEKIAEFVAQRSTATHPN